MNFHHGDPTGPGMNENWSKAKKINETRGSETNRNLI